MTSLNLNIQCHVKSKKTALSQYFTKVYNITIMDLNDNTIKVQSNHKAINVTMDSPYFQKVSGWSLNSHENSLIFFPYDEWMNEWMSKCLRREQNDYGKFYKTNVRAFLGVHLKTLKCRKREFLEYIHEFHNVCFVIRMHSVRNCELFSKESLDCFCMFDLLLISKKNLNGCVYVEKLWEFKAKKKYKNFVHFN